MLNLPESLNRLVIDTQDGWFKNEFIPLVVVGQKNHLGKITSVDWEKVLSGK